MALGDSLRQRRAEPSVPRTWGPCRSLVGPSRPCLCDHNGSVGADPNCKGGRTQERTNPAHLGEEAPAESSTREFSDTPRPPLRRRPLRPAQLAAPARRELHCLQASRALQSQPPPGPRRHVHRDRPRQPVALATLDRSPRPTAKEGTRRYPHARPLRPSRRPRPGQRTFCSSATCSFSAATASTPPPGSTTPSRAGAGARKRSSHQP